MPAGNGLFVIRAGMGFFFFPVHIQVIAGPTIRKGAYRLKTAIWLYLFLFVAFFDLHAQYPVLTPFAVSLGAAPSFIGLMMGMYALTHLPGNLLAGYGVDRYGSRIFIVTSLVAAGVILLFQSRVTDPWQLLVLRSISGFVLAFLSPACMALLAGITRDRILQGKLMAGNGLVHTLASVVSPAAGAVLVARIGFADAFVLLGWVLIITGFCAFLFVRNPRIPAGETEAGPWTETAEVKPDVSGRGPLHRPSAGEGEAVPFRRRMPEGVGARGAGGATPTSGLADEGMHGPFIWLFFLLPMAISCSQGILFFELPLRDTSTDGIMATGLLFSLVSIGSLVTLSLLFLNRWSPLGRTMAGSLLLALAFYCMAANVPVPFAGLLLAIGMAKGVVFPAMSSLLIGISGRGRYGRMFSFFSVASSIGAFLGPLSAGYVREHVSSYFLAFVGLMLVAAVLPFHAAGSHRIGLERQQ
jgi:MFS family permease